jgi:hypothetical protein
VNQRLRTREWAGVDYYGELGVTPLASRAAIDEAYRRQAKALHPDRNPDATAEDGFKRLTAAYEVLRDPATREAYDDFRYRVDAGLLYASVPAPPRTPTRPPVTYGTRPRKVRRPLPPKVRLGIGWTLIAMGIACVLWAVVGPLPSHTAGDTDIAVQITIGIMAAKLLVGGVVVIKYPALKARWHREPGTVTPPNGRGDHLSLENVRNLT